MALPSGFDVKIGDYEFMLDADAEEPYAHAYVSLAPEESEIIGWAGAKDLEPNIIRWGFDDFSGGDGQKYYDKEDPYTWWGGACNPRIIGAVQSVPPVSQNSHTTSNSAPTHGLHYINTGGRLWLFVDRQAFYSTDNGATWDASAANPLGGSASHLITAVAHDGEWPWFAITNGTVRELWRMTAVGAAEQVINDVTTAAKFYGMAELNGRIFGWTGKNLLRYPVTTAAGTDQTSSDKVWQPYTEGAFSNTAYGGIVAAEDAVILFLSSFGKTNVWVYKHKNHFPLIEYEGFTAKGIAYNQGVTALIGEEQGRVKLHAVSHRSRQAIPLGDVGWYYGLSNARCISRGPGATFLIGVDDGTTNYLYSYDLELDAFSVVQTSVIASRGTINACVTSGNRRVFGGKGTSTTSYSDSVQSDDTTPTGAFTWDSPAWDFGYPYASKQLLGFDVMNDQTLASGTATVYYQDDEDGTWTSAGTISAASKHTYIDVASSNINFHTLRMRIVGASGCRILNIAARVRIQEYQEVWRLVLAIKNEGQESPGGRRKQAHVLRDYIHTIVSNKTAVTFLDGKRYAKPGGNNDGYKTHTVVVESPVDYINADDNDGRIELILKAVS